jgi:ATP-dependent Lhr-like helicase
LSLDELTARSEADERAVQLWVEQLSREHRAFVGTVGGYERVCAAEDAARLRDALGVAIPVGLPAAFTEPVDAPLVELVARYARTHGPLLPADVATRMGAGADRVRVALDVLERDGRVVRGEFRPGGVEREWCDDDVLRTLRRRTLAVLRREVEPVDAATLARFLPRWQGVGARRRGPDALVDVLTQLQGAPLVASTLETDVLPARLDEYSPADLDELCTAGELVWVGAGAIGANDGRIRLAFRDSAGLLLAAPAASDDLGDAAHRAIVDHLERRGASFWSDLVAACRAAGAPYDETAVLAALWDLVWAGAVTNDSLTPLRVATAGRTRRPSAARSAANRRGRPLRPRPGGLSRLGPPAGAGRWSLVAPLLEPRPSPTEVAHALATQLVERYGVLTREGALGEGVEGGFAGVYPVLKALEDRGQVRRGYFVAGLGAAQFALPGAVDRLRSSMPDSEGAVLTLAATDPAQPYGAALAWPESTGRPARAAGARVVLVDGECAAYLERGGRSVVLFASAAGDDRWAAGLAQLVAGGRVRSLEIRTVDGIPILEHPAAATALRSAGFKDGYRGLVMRVR